MCYWLACCIEECGFWFTKTYMLLGFSNCEATCFAFVLPWLPNSAWTVCAGYVICLWSTMSFYEVSCRESRLDITTSACRLLRMLWCFMRRAPISSRVWSIWWSWLRSFWTADKVYSYICPKLPFDWLVFVWLSSFDWSRLMKFCFCLLIRRSPPSVALCMPAMTSSICVGRPEPPYPPVKLVFESVIVCPLKVFIVMVLLYGWLFWER